MKRQCSISSRYLCLWFCVSVYGLVVKPVNTTTSAEAVKLSSFSLLGVMLYFHYQQKSF